MASVTEIKGYRKDAPRHMETTDMALFVRTSSEAMDGWDRSNGGICKLAYTDIIGILNDYVYEFFD